MPGTSRTSNPSVSETPSSTSGRSREFLDFPFLYFIQVGVGAIMIELDAGRVGLHLTTLEVLSASLATLKNIGPGFGILGRSGVTASSRDLETLDGDVDVARATRDPPSPGTVDGVILEVINSLGAASTRVIDSLQRGRVWTATDGSKSAGTGKRIHRTTNDSNSFESQGHGERTAPPRRSCRITATEWPILLKGWKKQEIVHPPGRSGSVLQESNVSGELIGQFVHDVRIDFSDRLAVVQVLVVAGNRLFDLGK